MENVSILLVKKDGTIIDMSLSGGSIQPKDGKTNCIKGDVLPEIVISNVDWEAMNAAGFTEEQQLLSDAFENYGIKENTQSLFCRRST